MRLRSVLAACAVALAVAATAAAPSHAIVGGSNASPGEYPAVALITFGPFQCTGTLIAPDHVLSAGHCSSITGVAVASPVSWPEALIDVRIGGHKYGEGERVPVARATAHPAYLATMGYDISLLRLTRAATSQPVQVSGKGEESLWAPGTMETIVGWGVTEEGGDEAPDILQEAEVPVTTDGYCSDRYGSDFEAATMICAGFPEGGVDACQGDSGGPMFGRTSGGTLRVVGATSWGEGCARKGKPGVYARVGDTILREWIRGQVPAGVAPDAGSGGGTSTKGNSGKGGSKNPKASAKRGKRSKRAR